MNKKILLIIIAVVALVAYFAIGKLGAGNTPYIAVVSKGEQHDFWQQVKKGAVEAAQKYNVEMTFEGPPSESDIQIQVEMLKNAMSKEPVAIALAALSTSSVIEEIRTAQSKNIPIIGFDSGVPDAPQGAIFANASTDNFNAAGVAAQRMFEVIKSDIESATVANPVTIVVMNQDATGESLLSRGKGFRDNMIELIASETSLAESDIRVTGNPAYIDPSNPTSGKKVIIEMVVPASASATDTTSSASAVLGKVASNNILGIFCSNEATVKGILAATDDGATIKRRYSNLAIIGFDAGAAQKNAVRNGYFLGSVTQDPYQIGYQAIELAYKAYKGEPVSDIDTGAKFYDSYNMDDADISGLLYD